MYRRPGSARPNGAFKPPRMTTPQSSSPATSRPASATDSITENTAPPQKPRAQIPAKRPVTTTAVTSSVPSKKPKSEEQPSTDSQAEDTLRYFEVVWRKYTTKKNKTWDGDGVAILSPTYVSFRLDQSDNFKEKSRVSNVSKFTTDGVFSMGSFELEVMSEIFDSKQIDTIRSFTKTGALKADIAEEETAVRPLKQLAVKREPAKINKQFKPVVGNHEVSAKPKKGEPLYDPADPDAIKMIKADIYDTDVIIDPFLAKKLRPHQVKGVKFLYECVMDLRGFDGHGALLADDMGLGKTLQTITLIWTLLKQSPQGFERPTANKILIACPVTLIGNWKREFKKWLPMNRLNVLTLHSKNTISKDKQDVKNFARTKVYQVLIMGYEKILNMKEELAHTDFDLLICDEGHRLKNNSNKTLQALNSLNIERKVLLSGTPIQNDLSEFFNIIDFINPGILGNFNQFKRKFMNPILRSRDVNCTDPTAREDGEMRSQELIALTKPFILRRTAAVIANHLPPRTDVVLFCPPTSTQVNLFHQVLNSHRFTALLNSSTTTAAGSLGLITMFKKICNSPSLITNDKTFNEITESSITASSASGKLIAFQDLLMEIYRCGEKVVVVSNYTQTLDILQSIMTKLNLTHCRLDGSTPKKDRDSIVNQFNISPQRKTFAFLLSSKSGGIGLNLIGASRLILFDNDWNPSVDLQAMARIHRDGQKRPVFIYRLITTGCIDEKIFQRQLMKNNLSDKFLDNKSGSTDNLFETEDLRDLFTVNEATKCNTHDLIECDCGGSGEEIVQDDEDSDEEEKPKVPALKRESSWISALEIKNTIPEDENTKKNTIKKCLVGYRHVDPTRANSPDCSTGDEVVERIITQNPKAFTFIFTKVNKPTL